MIGFGILLIILGIGSLILPQFNIQFRLMSLLDDLQPAAGIVIAAIGALLLVLGMRGQRSKPPQDAPPRV
ncbi:MAG: hypothetical protein ICV68_01465 [Pyrinomonadaceae bacterium]|nr:hypothetical protein [Pyrinomonadaceae bacterium]